MLNLGLHDTASSPSPALPPLASFAASMGLDLSEFGDQAEGVWETLNDLHASDPESYQKFIEEQLKHGGPEEESGRPHFTPEAGFAVQVDDGGLRVNFCRHEAVQRPKTGLIETATTMDGLEIPLVVSEVRKIKKDKCIVDVVLHPWCVDRALHDNVFQCQLIELGLTWVYREHEGELAPQCTRRPPWTVLKSNTYASINDDNVVSPFYFDPDMLKKQQEEQRERDGGPAKRAPGKDANANADTTSSTIDIDIDTPAQLLRSMTSNSNIANTNERDDDVSNLFHLNQGTSTTHTSSTSHTKPRPLVQEITNLPTNTSNNKVHGNKKPNKGFDGTKGTGGSYARLLSKCRVINTTSSSSEHAVTAQKPDLKKDRNTTTKSSFRKGFLTDAKKQSKHTATVLDGTFEEEWRKLMEVAKVNSSSCRESPVNSEEKESSETPSLPQHDDGPSSDRTEETMENRSTTTMKKRLPYRVTNKPQKIVLHIDIAACATDIDLQSMELRAYSSTLTLTTSCGGTMRYDFEVDVDTTRVSAKLDTTTRTVKVVCPIVVAG